MILDFIFNYFGISSLIIFSYIFIFNKSILNIIIIGLVMDLFYFNYFLIYLLISYIIIKKINKYLKNNIFIDIIFLYIMTLIYYLITVKIYDFKLIFLYSFLPCIFYIVFHIIKYEIDKQNINRYNINPMYINRTKKK